MQKIKLTHAEKIEGESSTKVDDCLLVETPLQIIVNGQDLSMTMQTPGAELLLARGLLFAEGISNDAFDSFSLEEWEQGQVARIQLTSCKKIDSRRFSSHSSCGICGKRNVEALFEGLNPVKRDSEFDLKNISSCFEKGSKKQSLFSLTGGSHAAGAFDKDGQLICLFEDIGRHNAVDKVVGYLLENKLLDKAEVLTVSGRVSFEIIQKCVRAGIPVLASISAVSSLALEWADKMNLTLMAFCRDGRGTIYTKNQLGVM